MAAKRPGHTSTVDRAEAAFLAGDAARARTLLDRCAVHHADDARALLILGAALFALHDYAAAEARTRAAIAGWRGVLPSSLLNNLGMAVVAQGRIAEGITTLFEAVRIAPNSRDFRANLALALHGVGRRTEAASVALGAAGAPENVIAAIVAYEDGDVAECRRILDLVRPGFAGSLADGMDARQWHNMDVYSRYLGELIAYRDVHEARFGSPEAAPAVPRSEMLTAEMRTAAMRTAEVPALYVVGDSHTLAPAGMRVTFLGVRWRVVPLLVIGAKAWHLAHAMSTGVEDRYARAFQIALDRVPAGSTVVSTLGEIDCRVDDGILPHARAHPDEPLDRAVAGLVRGYAAFVRHEAARRDIVIHLAGVPAPNPRAVDAPDAARARVEIDRAELASVVRRFNDVLALAAAEADVALIDVYSLTADASGLATGRRHLDTHHLLPEVFAEAARSAGSMGGAGVTSEALAA